MMDYSLTTMLTRAEGTGTRETFGYYFRKLFKLYGKTIKCGNRNTCIWPVASIHATVANFEICSFYFFFPYFKGAGLATALLRIRAQLVAWNRMTYSLHANSLLLIFTITHNLTVAIYFISI